MAHVIVSGVDTGRCIQFIQIDAHVFFRKDVHLTNYESEKCEDLYNELTKLINKYFPVEGDGEILSDREFNKIGGNDGWERNHYHNLLKKI